MLDFFIAEERGLWIKKMIKNPKKKKIFQEEPNLTLNFIYLFLPWVPHFLP